MVRCKQVQVSEELWCIGTINLSEQIMELRPPRKRKGASSRTSNGPPLPIFVETPSGFVADDSLAPVFRGCFNGCSVIVDNPEEMKMLYNMGYFGKGSLSRSFPNFGLGRRGKPPFIFETQWQRRKEWIEKIQQAYGFCTPSNTTGSSSNRDSPSDQIGDESKKEDSARDKVNDSKEKSSGSVSKEDSHFSSKDCDILIIKDLNNKGLDPQPRIESELVQTVVEVSHLSLEEAFFLCYGLGCLEITNLTGNLLNPDECWEVFKSSQKDFIECYVAYHHFRAKGWVVKSGLKYGGHFVLYTSKGPTLYHSSYVVIVENVGKPGVKPTDAAWEKYSSLNRVAEQANKEILLCQVKWPPPDELEFKSPKIISRFRVKECVIGRWNASTNPSSED